MIGNDTVCCVTKPQLVRINVSLSRLSTLENAMQSMKKEISLCEEECGYWREAHSIDSAMRSMEALRYENMRAMNDALDKSLRKERNKKTAIGIGVGVGCTLLGIVLGVLIAK